MESTKNQGLRFPKLERQKLSGQLKHIRLLIGLQAKDVARELKISPANLTRIEHAQLNYGVDTLLSIADYYGFEVKIVLDASKVVPL